jgi:hypothetical protein
MNSSEERHLTSLPSYDATIHLSDTEQSIYKNRHKFTIFRPYTGLTISWPESSYEGVSAPLNEVAEFKYLLELGLSVVVPQRMC